ncbi:MAG: GNAT family N-acetyltransferase [Gammaproteobacteria bacterium]|nr:GNAT family N-acetyltransferase [Gammaproteobacteria bacterium]
MSNFEIREAGLDDANEIGKLICTLATKFITPEFSSQAREHFLSSNNGKSVEQNMKSGFSYFVATDSKQLVGVVGVKDNSHLYHLFVVEHYQGMGLARRLWGIAMDECKRKGNRGTFTVNSSNNAIGVYEKLGFERAGPTVEKDGVFFNPMEYRSDC